MIKISVIIPTYKPGDYLWKCLDSLRNQSLSRVDFEVILVLNGCDEPWRGYIERYIKEKKIINYQFLHTITPGVSNARNMALDKAIGEYITFIDDDDFVSPSYLEELYKRADENVISLCYPLSFVDGSDNYEPYYITNEFKDDKEGRLYSYLKARRYFSGPVYKMIHRNIIWNRRYNTSFKNGEDSIFMFEISDRFKTVAFTSRNAIYYRRIRQGSALLRKKGIFEIISNCIKMIVAYAKIYFKHPHKYNFIFFVTRVLGAVHGGIEQFKLKKH